MDKQILDEVWNVSDYFKPNTDEYFKFGQYVKKDFSADFDNEHAQLEPTEVNGKSGLCYELNRWSVLIWDNEDYILKMSGDFTKDELISLAKTIEKRKLDANDVCA